VLRTASVRVLDNRDLSAARRLLATNPVENVFPASRVEVAGLDSLRLGAEVWGYPASGPLESLCYSGANLVPVQPDRHAVRAFAEHARRRGRRCSSLLGTAHAVEPLWAELAPAWGPPRSVRRRQPLLLLDSPPALAGDPLVRRVRPDEVDVLLPAAIAMFTEEVGVSPLSNDGGALYRTRVQQLVQAGRAFARIENGEVVFKAEVGETTAAACQIHGVWVHPAVRGRGLGTAGMAAVAAEALRSIAPLVSLYVNDFNAAARASYAKVGFRQVGTFMSVLF